MFRPDSLAQLTPHEREARLRALTAAHAAAVAGAAAAQALESSWPAWLATAATAGDADEAAAPVLHVVDLGELVGEVRSGGTQPAGAQLVEVPGMGEAWDGCGQAGPSRQADGCGSVPGVNGCSWPWSNDGGEWEAAAGDVSDRLIGPCLPPSSDDADDVR